MPWHLPSRTDRSQNDHDVVIVANRVLQSSGRVARTHARNHPPPGLGAAFAPAPPRRGTPKRRRRVVRARTHALRVTCASAATATAQLRTARPTTNADAAFRSGVDVEMPRPRSPRDDVVTGGQRVKAVNGVISRQRVRARRFGSRTRWRRFQVIGDRRHRYSALRNQHRRRRRFIPSTVVSSHLAPVWHADGGGSARVNTQPSRQVTRSIPTPSS